MSEKLPNWNLNDFYSSIEDEQINYDLENFKNLTLNFHKKYKDKLLSQSQKFEKIIQEYEEVSEIGDKLGNYAFLIYSTNMNEQKIVQFYQGINEKLTEISSNLIFFQNEIPNFSKLKEFSMILNSRQIEEGGFFVMIGQKIDNK